jgi:sRNA-binding regulator protein Hfq
MLKSLRNIKVRFHLMGGDTLTGTIVDTDNDWVRVLQGANTLFIYQGNIQYFTVER